MMGGKALWMCSILDRPKPPLPRLSLRSCDLERCSTESCVRSRTMARGHCAMRFIPIGAGVMVEKGGGGARKGRKGVGVSYNSFTS